jgi:hypothetical protein
MLVKNINGPNITVTSGSYDKFLSKFSTLGWDDVFECPRFHHVDTDPLVRLIHRMLTVLCGDDGN